MKRWLFVPMVVVALLSWVALPARAAEEAEKDKLSLTVTNADGEEFDLIDEAGGDALIAFIDANKLTDDDVDDIVAFFEAMSEAIEKDEKADDQAAAYGVPGVSPRAEEEAEDEDAIDIVLVVLGDKEDWPAIKKELEADQAEDLTVVLADPKEDDEELDAFELPEDLVWAVYLVEDYKVTESFESLEDLKKAEDEIQKELKD